MKSFLISILSGICLIIVIIILVTFITAKNLEAQQNKCVGLCSVHEQIAGYCGNTNIAITAINICRIYQFKQVDKISELFFKHGNTVPWSEFRDKCWFESFHPNFVSFEKMYKCLEIEVNKLIIS